MAAITKHHKLGTSKQQRFLLTVLEARNAKSRCQQRYTTSKGSGREPFPLLQLQAAPGIPWLVSTSLQFSLCFLLLRLCLLLHVLQGHLSFGFRNPPR